MTAVEFLIEKLDNNLDIKHSWRTKQYIEQANKMFEEQIMEAYWYGNQDVGYKLLAEQYYNKTFKSE
jgi:hypothetical protein